MQIPFTSCIWIIFIFFYFSSATNLHQHCSLICSLGWLALVLHSSICTFGVVWYLNGFSQHFILTSYSPSRTMVVPNDTKNVFFLAIWMVWISLFLLPFHPVTLSLPSWLCRLPPSLGKVLLVLAGEWMEVLSPRRLYPFSNGVWS